MYEKLMRGIEALKEQIAEQKEYAISSDNTELFIETRGQEHLMEEIMNLIYLLPKESA